MTNIFANNFWQIFIIISINENNSMGFDTIEINLVNFMEMHYG